MAWGSKGVDDPNVREALVKVAWHDAKLGKPTERTYLAALLIEQVRTNDLLEQLVREKSATAQ